jgi:cation transport regulator ChaB
MTLEGKKDLSEHLRKSMPEEAQEIYVKAYNKSWENYDEDDDLGKQSREAVAHRDGWAAVKREFVHDEERGIWYRHGEEPEEDEEPGIVDQLKSLT